MKYENCQNMTLGETELTNFRLYSLVVTIVYILLKLKMFIIGSCQFLPHFNVFCSILYISLMKTAVVEACSSQSTVIWSCY